MVFELWGITWYIHFLSWICPSRGLPSNRCGRATADGVPSDAEEGFDDDTDYDQEQAGAEPSHDSLLNILVP